MQNHSLLKAALPTNGALTGGASSRLGKKQLRRLRHQQVQLSPRDFLWASAQRLASKGHAHILAFQKSDSLAQSAGADVISQSAAGDSEGSAVQIDSPESIRVVTSSDWTSPSIDNLIKSLKDDTNQVVATVLVRPLLVLDLNGILCHRIRRNRIDPAAAPAQYRESIATVASTPIIPRSDLVPFLLMLRRHFCLAIWTSAKAKTATQLLNKLLPPDLLSSILFVYAQHHCRAISTDDDCDTKTAERMDGPVDNSNSPGSGWKKPIFEKDLSLVWQSFPLWNANNTVLYDDSPEKCLQWQSNAIHPPPLTGTVLDDPIQQQQAQGLQRLADHWANEPGMLVWDSEGDDSTWFRTSQQSTWLRDEMVKLGWGQAPA